MSTAHNMYCDKCNKTTILGVSLDPILCVDGNAHHMVEIPVSIRQQTATGNDDL